MMPDFGLIGKKLSHSYSPEIHAQLGNYGYGLYELSEDGIGPFLKSGKLDGANVTIPYKKAVLEYMDEISEDVKAVGSVNTVIRLPDGRLRGENTDIYGFHRLAERSGYDLHGKKVLVLGSGGACASVCAALGALGADTVIISRSGKNNYGNLQLHRDAKAIVNTTPLGMYPENGAMPLDPEAFPLCECIFDIIYNPARTALMLRAEELGIPCFNGLYMLVAQAKRSAELFCGRKIPDSETDRICSLLERRMRNIVLIGMPGCGKSSTAQALGEISGREVLESDKAIEERTGLHPSDFIKKYGEESFRKEECAVLAELGKLSGKIISTGGGAVTRSENYASLHQNGIIVWIKRDLAHLATEGRPLSDGADLRAMYERRAPLYEKFADVSVSNENDITVTAEKTAGLCI